MGKLYWPSVIVGVQQSLLVSDPKTYFVPAYVGHRGWIGVRLDDTLDWEEVTELIEESYRLIAPKRLQALLPNPVSPHNNTPKSLS